MCMHLSITINLFHYPVYNMPFSVSLLFTHFHSMPRLILTNLFNNSFVSPVPPDCLPFRRFYVCFLLPSFVFLPLFVSFSTKYMLSSVLLLLCLHFISLCPRRGGQKNMHIIYSIHTQHRVRFSKSWTQRNMYRRRQLRQQFYTDFDVNRSISNSN